MKIFRIRYILLFFVIINLFSINSFSPKESYNFKERKNAISNPIISDYITIYFFCDSANTEDYQISITPLSKIEEPVPYRFNADFDGWYTSRNYDVKWDFENDVFVESTYLYAKWSNWCTTRWVDYKGGRWGSVETYLSHKYVKSNSWELVDGNSTINVNGGAPVNIHSDFFPSEDIEDAINETKKINKDYASSYGGCGPIAMIGILDYYSRNFGYTSIMEDPYNSNDRIKLATDVFLNVETSEIGMGSKEDNNENQDDDDEENQEEENKKESYTYTSPSDYAKGFNDLATKYNINNEISATSYGIMTGSNKLKKVIDSIDKGIPVTMYNGAIGKGKGCFSAHYVNIFEYQKWIGYDVNGKLVENYFFNTMVNFGYAKNDDYYDYNEHQGNLPRICDAEMLNLLLTGIITYDVKNNNQIIKKSDFLDISNLSSNEIPFSKNVLTNNKFLFNVISYGSEIINNYYVLLPKSNSNNFAYINFNLDFTIKAINIDLSYLTEYENINTELFLEAYYNNQWNLIHTFNLENFSFDPLSPSNYYFSFIEEVSSIRIKASSNESETNSSISFVIGDINFFTNDTIEYHYECDYINYENHSDYYHKSICECGEYVLEEHYLTLININGTVYNCCSYCSYQTSSTGEIIVRPFDKEDEMVSS